MKCFEILPLFSLFKAGAIRALSVLLLVIAAACTPESKPPEEPPPLGASEGEAPHGPETVLRASDKLEGESELKLSLNEPNWKNPTETRFVTLKTMYRTFRDEKSFPQEEAGALNGSAVVISGAVMPIDPVGESGELRRFWLCNPIVVMAGCVFCAPPTMGDLVYVRVKGKPIKVSREQLYKSVVRMKALGRFYISPMKSEGDLEYIFSMELEKVLN